MQRVDALSQSQKGTIFQFASAFCAAVFVVILVLFLLSTAKTASVPKSSVVAFVDGNLDDLYALQYLLRRGDVNLQMVVVTGVGRTHLSGAFQNVVNFLALTALFGGAGPVGRLRVGVGNVYSIRDQGNATCRDGRPWLDGPRLLQADAIYGASAVLRQALSGARTPTDIPPSNLAGPPLPFEQPLSDLLTASPDQSVTFVCLAPLTDVATFLLTRPQLVKKLIRVVMSGGTLSAGDVSLLTRVAKNTVSEANFFWDADAARTVTYDLALPTLITLLEARMKLSLSSSTVWAPLAALLPSVTPKYPAAYFVNSAADPAARSGRPLSMLHVTAAMADAVRRNPTAASNPAVQSIGDVVTAALAVDWRVRGTAQINQGRLTVVVAPDDWTVTGRLGKAANVSTTSNDADMDRVVLDVDAGLIWAQWVSIIGLPFAG